MYHHHLVVGGRGRGRGRGRKEVEVEDVAGEEDVGFQESGKRLYEYIPGLRRLKGMPNVDEYVPPPPPLNDKINCLCHFICILRKLYMHQI